MSGSRPGGGPITFIEKLRAMNRVISMLVLIVAALASSSVQGFVPSSLGGVSGGGFAATAASLPDSQLTPPILTDDPALPDYTELNAR